MKENKDNNMSTYNESRRADSNYPLMSQSEWDNAPWNQSEPEEKEFTMSYQMTLSFDAKVMSTEYGSMEEYVGDAVEDFEEQHYSLKELLQELIDRLKKEKQEAKSRWTKNRIQEKIEDAVMYRDAVLEIEEA